MKIIHVTAGIQETCGVSQFVVNIARAQQVAGHEVEIVTTMTCGFPVDDLKVVLTETPVAAVEKAVGGKSDRDVVLHLHTLFGRYCISVARWARMNHVPYVISPHGALMPNAVKVNYWKKWIFLRLFSKEFQSAAGFHVTAKSEVEAVKRFFGKTRPIVLAPLGATLSSSNQTILNSKSSNSLYRDVVFVGRIHPVKNLTSLIRAWALLKKGIGVSVEESDVSKDELNRHCPPPSLFSTFSPRLVIAGSNDVGHQEELVELAKELGLKVVDFSHDLEFGKKTIFGGGEVPLETFQSRLADCVADVVFAGPVYSAAKDWMFAHACVSVLPSHSENFGGVVVESLAQGTPIIASKGTPWQALEENACGWWVDATPERLAETLSIALRMSEFERSERSAKANEFVRREFSWDSSARKVTELYGKIVNK